MNNQVAVSVPIHVPNPVSSQHARASRLDPSRQSDLLFLVQGGNLDLTSQHSLRHRQRVVEVYVRALSREEGMRFDVDGDVDMAGGLPTVARLSLVRHSQPDVLVHPLSDLNSDLLLGLHLAAASAPLARRVDDGSLAIAAAAFHLDMQEAHGDLDDLACPLACRARPALRPRLSSLSRARLADVLLPDPHLLGATLRCLHEREIDLDVDIFPSSPPGILPPPTKHAAQILKDIRWIPTEVLKPLKSLEAPETTSRVPVCIHASHIIHPSLLLV
mmetsp:Transcript_23406/g.52582  ORF Transcript_23406/g.52582 Transcript_23406/m.52582 type:complete len:274 (+) Transcript_23406:319-1140(+)